MKTHYRFLTVCGFYCFLALLGTIGQDQAEAGANRFYFGYKAYLAKDFSSAFIHWEPLAENGNPDAQYFLGIMLLNGEGVKKNWPEAAKWFEASAHQGDVGAQYIFGEMNLKGMGMVRDYRKAGAWFKKSAEQDYPDAQFRLGEWYANGKGGVTNFVLAYAWLKLAGANGIQAGDEKKKQVKSQLNDKEINHANQLAYQWWLGWSKTRKMNDPEKRY